MQFSQIKETCLYVTDLDRTENFYHGKLQMPVISKVAGRHIFFRCGASVLLCFIGEITKNEENLPPHFAQGPQHIAFEVASDAYEATRQQIMGAQIVITHTEKWSGGFESFYFEDPDGHVLEIVPAGMWG